MIECHVRCDFCNKTGPNAMTPTDAKIVAHKKGWTIGKPHRRFHNPFETSLLIYP